MAKSKFLVLVFVVLSFTTVKASYKTDIYDAYVAGNMVKWKKIIDEMDLQKVKNNEFILELVNYQYGYVMMCVTKKQDDLAEQYLNLAEKNVQLLESNKYKLSMVAAYKSAFIGFRIGISPYKAPFLGSKSTENAKLAIELDKNNPYGYIQFGTGLYHTPSIFGGSKTLALDNLSQAQRLMELDETQIKNDWNYLYLLTFMAKIYTEIGLYGTAKLYYEKILKSEQNFLLVKNELYPQLLKKIK